MSDGGRGLIDQAEIATARSRMAELESELAMARAGIAELETAQADQDRREGVQAALYRIASAASAVDEMQAFYAEIHDIVASLMFGESLYIALYDEERGMINFPYYHDAVDVDIPDPDLWEPIGMGNARGLTAYVLRTGTTEWVTAERMEVLEAAGEVDSVGAQSEDWLGAPLRSDGRVIGVLVVQTYRPDEHYSDDDARLLTFVAQHVAAALTRARAVAEVRRRNAELAVVNEVAGALARQLDFDAITAAVGERAAQAIAADGLSIAIVQPESRQLRFVFCLDQGERLPELEGKILDDVLSARIVASGQPIRVGSGEEATAIGAPFKFSGTESYLGVPIPAGDRTIGVIAIGTIDQHAYGPDDERLLSSLAMNMGVALENARLFEETNRLLAETGRQKQYFERLVEISPVAVVTMDREEIVSGWNPAATTLFGYQPDEALGRHIDDLIFAPEEREEGAAAVRLVDEWGRIQQIGRRRRRDGRLVDVEIVAVPLLVDDEHVGYYAIYHDITELVAARREADAANESKSTFLASMSHEIRTPMNAIIGMSGLMLETSLEADQRDFAETIRTSGEALLTIINDILDFSKIEAGHIELEVIPFALGACIEGALDVIAPSAAAKELELVYTIAPDLPHAILGDPGRLRQIVLNLLSNAIKFTEAGEVVVSVSGRRLEEPGADSDAAARWEIAVAVRDTGIGIAADRMDRLFQSFSQADASISRRYGGTGLGLAISKRLAELQGGSITAVSSGVAGNGSRFTVRIVAPEAAAETVPGPAPRSGELAGKDALVVGDGSTTRRILVSQLRRWGMTVQAMGSAREAIDRVRGGSRFDIALVEHVLPDVDGKATAIALREASARPLPVVMVSSLGDRGSPAEDAVAWLTKPIKPSALLDAVHGALVDIDVVGPAGAAPDGVPLAGVAPPTSADSMGQRHPLRILLAEDNAVNQKLALRLLERMGYTADVAGNGLEVIAALEAGTFDLVLMDVQMPELDGLEATRRIRQRWPGAGGPHIVAMTANAMAGDRELCLASGMDDYISKPIRVEELVDALEATPGRGGGGRADV
jgi:PAS domain S-box-containing protein